MITSLSNFLYASGAKPFKRSECPLSRGDFNHSKQYGHISYDRKTRLWSFREKYGLIGIGKVGWHATGENESLSGYNTDPDPPAYMLNQAWPGAFVYDARNAPLDVFTTWVFRGPIVKFGAPAHPEPKGFDYVPAWQYIELLRARVPNVRFGRVACDHTVVWETTP